MANIQTVFIAKGDVQKVGYRDAVQKIALEMGIKGYVRNLEDRTIEIVCEGEQKEIEKFKKAVAIKDGFIKVTEIKVVKAGKATNKFKIFTIKKGDMAEEVGDRMDAAMGHLKVAVVDIKGAIEKGNNDLKTTIKEGNVELGNKMDKGFHMLGDRIDNNFNKMEQKYDVISQTMIRMLDELKETRTEIKSVMEEQKQARVDSTKAVDNLTKVVQTFVEMQKKQ